MYFLWEPSELKKSPYKMYGVSKYGKRFLYRLATFIRNCHRSAVNGVYIYIILEHTNMIYTPHSKYGKRFLSRLATFIRDCHRSAVNGVYIYIVLEYTSLFGLSENTPLYARTDFYLSMMIHLPSPPLHIHFN